MLAAAKRGEVVDVPITSLSLLSGDWVRDKGYATHSNERLMNGEQRAMFQKLSGEEISITLGGAANPVTIRVRSQPLVADHCSHVLH